MTDSKNGTGQSIGSAPPAENSHWGVVLVAHGSQRGGDRSECSCTWNDTASGSPQWCLDCPNTSAGLQTVVDRLQGILGLHQRQLVLSCLEFIEPHPDQAVKVLGERGFKQVVLAPFLLGNGKHATLELEEIIEGLRADAPDMELHLAEGMGADPMLAEVVVQRIQGMNDGAHPRLQPGRTAGVLLVKAGTKTMYDDCRWLVELGRLVEDRLGSGYAVEVAQSHYGDPTMEAAIEGLVHGRGAFSVTCVPYLLFPGLILKRNVLGELDRLQRKYPGLPMTATPPLGVDERVVAVAAERVRDLWTKPPSGGT